MFVERCDKCPARAKVQVKFDTGGQLFFCGSHHRTYFGDREHPGVTFIYDTVTVGG